MVTTAKQNKNNANQAQGEEDFVFGKMLKTHGEVLKLHEELTNVSPGHVTTGVSESVVPGMEGPAASTAIDAPELVKQEAWDVPNPGLWGEGGSTG